MQTSATHTSRCQAREDLQCIHASAQSTTGPAGAAAATNDDHIHGSLLPARRACDRHNVDRRRESSQRRRQDESIGHKPGCASATAAANSHDRCQKGHLRRSPVHAADHIPAHPVQQRLGLALAALSSLFARFLGAARALVARLRHSAHSLPSVHQVCAARLRGRSPARSLPLPDALLPGLDRGRLARGTLARLDALRVHAVRPAGAFLSRRGRHSMAAGVPARVRARALLVHGRRVGLFRTQHARRTSSRSSSSVRQG